MLDIMIPEGSGAVDGDAAGSVNELAHSVDE